MHSDLVRTIAAYVSAHLPEADCTEERVSLGIRRAWRAGARSASNIQLFVTLMFALEPEFDQRRRVRECLDAGEGSFDDRFRRLIDRSHPNCWYRMDRAHCEERWSALLNQDEHLIVNCELPEDEPLPSQLDPHYGFQLDVPFLMTPDATVRAMLELADVRPDDLVMDLGCGDGRVVITAAREFGARGIGVDLNPENIDLAMRTAAAAGVANRVSFYRRDLYDVDFAPASVITLYLLHRVNLRIRERLRSQLRPGSRVVSRAFDMGDWPPDAQMGEQPDMLYCWRL